MEEILLKYRKKLLRSQIVFACIRHEAFRAFVVMVPQKNCNSISHMYNPPF